MPYDAVSFSVVHILDVREQITAIKLAFVAKSEKPEVADAAHNILNYIDNVLRPWRNRFIHDEWFLGRKNEIERFNRTPRVLRTEARQPRTFIPADIARKQLPLIWKVVRDVRDHEEALYNLQSYFRDKPRVIAKLLRSLPKQRLRPRPPAAPRPKAAKPPKQKRPPEP